MYTTVPASVVINSHMYLPTPGFTVAEDPSAPVTLVAFFTALGIVIAVTLAPTVANIITLPNLPETGKLLKAKVQLKNETATVEILEDEKGISPGQACVIYSKDSFGERVVGGGWIDKTENKNLSTQLTNH